jgi:uncharacterized protein
MFEVRSSIIEGKGVFATHHIAIGQTILLMSGTPKTFDECVAINTRGDVQASDFLGIDLDLYLVLDEIPRSINHSCQPNTFIRGYNEVVCLRPIAPDEELTFDYSTTMIYDKKRFAAAGIKPWVCKCRCGSAQCRGVIDEFATLPQKTKKHYVEQNYLPDFMLRVFQQAQH